MTFLLVIEQLLVRYCNVLIHCCGGVTVAVSECSTVELREEGKAIEGRANN